MIITVEIEDGIYDRLRRSAKRRNLPFDTVLNEYLKKAMPVAKVKTQPEFLAASVMTREEVHSKARELIRRAEAREPSDIKSARDLFTEVELEVYSSLDVAKIVTSFSYGVRNNPRYCHLATGIRMHSKTK